MPSEAKCRNATSGTLAIRKLVDADGLYLWVYAVVIERANLSP
jgi:hypothetical protein